MYRPAFKNMFVLFGPSLDNTQWCHTFITMVFLDLAKAFWLRPTAFIYEKFWYLCALFSCNHCDFRRTNSILTIINYILFIQWIFTTTHKKLLEVSLSFDILTIRCIEYILNNKPQFVKQISSPSVMKVSSFDDDEDGWSSNAKFTSQASQCSELKSISLKTSDRWRQSQMDDTEECHYAPGFMSVVLPVNWVPSQGPRDRVKPQLVVP